MKRIYFNLFSAVLLLLATNSCKKDALMPGSGTSALMMVNGLVGSSRLYTNFNGDELKIIRFYGGLTFVSYGTYLLPNTSYLGQQKLGLYRPVDTLQGGKPLFNLILNLPVNTVNALFLTGTEQAPDTLFTTNQLPYHVPTDSTMSIRFVNISLGGNPVSVNLVGQANGSTLASLPYKGATGFKKYSARSVVDSYAFEFRDKVTGELLSSYKLEGINMIGSPENGGNKWLNNDITLTLFGPVGNKRVLLLYDKNKT
ncbi:hypothetical protein ABIE26_003169 [Pedobacter africanus]|uniref:Uncharacterized protein n=1 Tax=Pedobacter africanus TaxID=151894 RepID=A0ACC6KWQ1_9SPHI|nr:hypothetical protein [Pedobacter africanus]MDR6783513.1 hypothetical protein [Pedobacter africanus]